ncbi:hypothetical protein [Polaromonas sp.]|uniref:hypothetical protein n=1 Tax=Polaromonas sp. TaxID=1869339 RepID=UPI00180C8F5D|nr:hypothetical protein [Polaromonas sp.]NMM08155.1 DUF11 domain-containing protein [Polaromonas sp.]
MTSARTYSNMPAASPDFARHWKALAFGWFVCLQLTFSGVANAQTTFSFTGAVQTYTIPAGAGGIQLRALGAGGGGGGSDASGNGFTGAGGVGSAGAVANATFFGPPGTVVKVYVGGGGGRGFTSSFGRSCTDSAGVAGSAGGSGGFAGGVGGSPGCSGYSGGGGGGGGASVIANAANVTLVVAGSGAGGQGGSWMSAPNTALNSSAQGGLAAASAGGVGSSFVTDGGAGGGGGGGCAGGAGGDVHVDKTGAPSGLPAVAGGSCPNASLVSNFSIVAGAGGAGGAGAPGDPSNLANGGQPGSNGSVVITPLSPTLSLVKSSPSPALLVGSNSSYTLTVSNTATTPAYTATIQDQLPANLTYVSGVGSNWGCGNAAGLVTCTFSGTIAPATGISVVVISVTPTSNATVTNYAAVDPKGSASPPNASACTAANTPSAGCAAPVISAVNLAIRGTVYADANHNASQDGAETGAGVAGLFVKLAPSSGASCSSPAFAAVPVDSGTGAYSLPSVAQGSYCLILDTNSSLSDISAGFPAGWIGTQNASGVIQLNVGTSPPPAQNFGRYNGSTVSGIVFADTGAGAGIGNNGSKDGTEPGIAGVTVNASAGVASAVTAGDGSYTLWVPATTPGAVIVTPAAPGGDLATGGSPGSTGGTYTRPGVSFTPVAGQSYSAVNFGLVPPSTLTPNGAQSALPGTVLFYDHTLQAGSVGQVTFSLANSAIPTAPAWSQVLYQDGNCNGVLDAGEPQISAPVSVTAGQKLCLIVKQFVPAAAALGAQNNVMLSAAFSYTGASPALSSTLTATDITSVGAPDELLLTKLVANLTQGSAPAMAVNAKPTDLLQYTLTAVNNGTRALNATVIKPLLISDATPAFTTYFGASALCPVSLPAGLICTAVSAPAASAPGALQWTFTGALAPSAQFSVTYQVRVDQ